MRPASRTLLFSRPARAIAAIRILVDAGTPVSRIAIQVWGPGIALRTRDPVDAPCLDQLLALGGEMVVSPLVDLPVVGPTVDGPTVDGSDRRLHARETVHR